MDIEFASEELQNYFTGNYHSKQPFSELILLHYRKVIKLMRDSENINYLSQFRGLNIEKYENHWSARINKQYRVEFNFIKPNNLVIIKISKHYE